MVEQKPGDVPHVLFINPWIHDFAAYDFWARPLGALYLVSVFQNAGFRVSYIDCLDRFHPKGKQQDFRLRYGRGPYTKTPLPTPKNLWWVKRRYSRYGIMPEWFKGDLAGAGKPDIVMVTSMMTYWYPGVCETIETVREIYPDVPVVLGGIYAVLCKEHAKTCSGADVVISHGNVNSILSAVGALTGYAASPKTENNNLDTYPYPAFYMQRQMPFVCMLTTRGCPYDCPYCASGIVSPGFRKRDPDAVFEEILYWHRDYGVCDFVFYDDALLVDARAHAIPLFEKILHSGLSLRFHTPNAMHLRHISKNLSVLMKKVGFVTLRFGLETYREPGSEMIDEKLNQEEFETAVGHLLHAGFTGKQIGLYLLAGLPGQKPEHVKESVNMVRAKGLHPILAYYSPIPGTKLWQKSLGCSGLDLQNEPLFTNNSLFPCMENGFSWEVRKDMKTGTDLAGKDHI